MRSSGPIVSDQHGPVEHLFTLADDQAVAGVVIAVGAIIGIYWRKAKKKVNDTLGIDENRNKEVESDEIIVDQAAAAEDEGDKKAE